MATLAKVTSTSPLLVVTALDQTNAIPATRVRGYTPALEWVWVELRTPLPPVIQGKAGS